MTVSLDLDLSCPAVPQALSPLRTIISALTREAGFHDEQVDQIEMAVDEACANVVRHAYPEGLEWNAGRDGAAAPRLTMQIALAPDRIRFRVQDDGIGLPANPQRAFSVNEFVERGGRGGLGSLIMEQFMDEVCYEVPHDTGRGTVLTMVKYRHTVRTSQSLVP